jgi:Flp pilus assembly protein TadG
MVEFALTLPLLALLLFSIIQYGFIFAAYMSLRNASAVGARYATLSPNPSDSDVRSVALGALSPMLSSNRGTVTVTHNVPVGSVSGATSVQIQYNLPLIVPFVVPGKTSGSTLSLSATTTMR